MQIKRQEVNTVEFIMQRRMIFTEVNFISQIKLPRVINEVMSRVGIVISSIRQKFLWSGVDVDITRMAHWNLQAIFNLAMFNTLVMSEVRR